MNLKEVKKINVNKKADEYISYHWFGIGWKIIAKEIILLIYLKIKNSFNKDINKSK